MQHMQHMQHMVVSVNNTSSTRQNITGGSAGAGGYSYQAEAVAAVEAKILAREGLSWIATACKQIPVALAAETGRDGDDLQVQLESGTLIEVQAKKGVQSGKKFWDAMTALALAAHKNPQVHGVLLTDSNASHTVRNDLRRDLIRLGQGRTDDLRSLSKEFLKRLEKLGVRGPHLVAACCARLRIVVADYEPGGQGEELIRATLRRIVFDADRVSDAHDALSKDGLALMVYRGRRERQSLEALLSSKGIALMSGPASVPLPLQEMMSRVQDVVATYSQGGVQAQQKLLGVETRALRDRVYDALRTHEYETARAEASELHRWMVTHADQLPGEDVADAYALLVEAKLNRPNRTTKADADAVTPASLQALLLEGERALARPGSPPALAEIVSRLFSLRALVTSLAHGPDVGLAMLAGREDPYAVRRRLAIFIRAGRFDEAADSVTRLPPHEEWADKAALVFAATGRDAEALDIIRWAKARVDAPWLAIFCAIVASDSACEGVFVLGPNELEGALRPPTPEDAARLSRARTFLNEVTAGVRTLRQIRSAPEMYALHREAVILARLGERAALGEVVSTLASYRPLPTIMADLVQHDLWPCDPAWPERLRREHPDNFEIEVLASLITKPPTDPARRREEFDRLARLARRAAEHEAEPGMRRAMLAHLGRLAAGLDGEISASLSAHETILIGDDARMRRTAQLVRLVNSGRFEEAASLLDTSAEPTTAPTTAPTTSTEEDEQDGGEEHPDSNVLLQCRAAIAAYRGRPDEALGYLRRAVSRLPHPALLHQTAEIAMQAGETEEAATLLERYLDLRPEDDEVRQRLALLHVQDQDFPKAAEQFAILWRLRPEDADRATNYGAALAHAGDLEGSARIYGTVCDGQDPPLRAVIALASVLKSLGRPQEAFARLIAHRERWWEEPQYLMAVSELGHAAQQDDTAFQALAQVRLLQEQGKAAPDIVRTFSVDEAVEMFTQRHRTSEDAQGYVLRGQLPWLCVDRMLNRTALESWHDRTRPLLWVGELPFAEAAAAVYATNSFFIDRRPERERAFRPLPNPQRDRPVVADLSALLTLHHLDLLDTAAGFFGRILLPSAYMPVALEEAGKLLPHQPSQKKQLEAVRAAVDGGRIAVSPALPTDQARVTLLDTPAGGGGDHEAGREPAAAAGGSHPPTHALPDVLRLLHERGLLTDQQMWDGRNLARVSSDRPQDQPQAPESLGAGTTALTYGAPFGSDLTTLKVLAGADLLEPLLEGFRVTMTEQDRLAMAADLEGFRKQEEMHTSHRIFWDRVRSDERFALVPYKPRPRPPSAAEVDRRREVDIAAALLAQERGLPLLADDRVSQSLIYSDPASPPGCYAFGTDRLIAVLFAGGDIASERAAELYLRLVRWRYRFLIPPPALLKALAMRHISHPPGKELKEVAEYVHACMRSAGLPLEQASQAPTSALGNWLFLNWIGTVIEFVCLLWTDQTVAAASATACTDWAIRHMLPSPPRAMGAAGAHFQTGLPEYVLSHALIHLLTVKDTARGNDALRCIAAAIGVPPERFVQTISEAMSAL